MTSWKKEIQESLRGIKASLKLRLSLLIHNETSKGVNSAIGDLTECFQGLKHVLWRFGSLLWLFYSERSQLGFLLSGGMRTHSPTCACVVNAYVRIRTHMCIGSLGFGFSFLFGMWFPYQGFPHDSYVLKDYSRQVQAQISIHQRGKANEKEKWNKMNTCLRFPWDVK